MQKGMFEGILDTNAETIIRTILGRPKGVFSRLKEDSDEMTLRFFLFDLPSQVRTIVEKTIRNPRYSLVAVYQLATHSDNDTEWVILSELKSIEHAAIRCEIVFPEKVTNSLLEEIVAHAHHHLSESRHYGWLLPSFFHPRSALYKAVSALEKNVAETLSAPPLPEGSRSAVVTPSV